VTPGFPPQGVAARGRGANVVVAAPDAPANMVAQADYVCDGAGTVAADPGDDVELQAGIDAS